MKAFVATINHLLLFDLEKQSIKVIESNRTEYYGISWWEKNPTLVLSHSDIDNNSLNSLKAYATSEKGYLSFGDRVSQRFLSQPHQILCAPDNIVITTNTGRNCVTFYNPENGYYKDLRINDIYWDRLSLNKTVGEHFNSIFLKNNRLYVLAHGFRKASYVLEFSYPDGCLLARYDIKKKTGMHNIWIDDASNIYVCHSDAGELIEVKSNETVWGSNTQLYSRGLAATKDFILLGDSKCCERGSRTNSLSAIWMIDRKNFKTIDYFQLGYYGAVHEIRLVDIPDEAHHGKVFNGLQSLEEKITKTICNERHIKLDLAKKWHIEREQFKLFDNIINGFALNKENWIEPKEGEFTLAMLKDYPRNNFRASLEYAFLKSNNLQGQHLSLVLGYRGKYDEKMFAVLLYYDQKNVSLSLWRNQLSDWEIQETILVNILTQGILAIEKQKDQLTIICNNETVFQKEFQNEELEGGVGVRCLGSQFRNFRTELLNENLSRPADIHHSSC